MHHAEAQGGPLSFAPMCVRLVEHHAAMEAIAVRVQTLTGRCHEMASIIAETADNLSVGDDATRLRICAEVIRDAATMAMGELERSEVTCRRIAADLKGAQAHA